MHGDGWIIDATDEEQCIARYIQCALKDIFRFLDTQGKLCRVPETAMMSAKPISTIAARGGPNDTRPKALCPVSIKRKAKYWVLFARILTTASVP